MKTKFLVVLLVFFSLIASVMAEEPTKVQPRTEAVDSTENDFSFSKSWKVIKDVSPTEFQVKDLEFVTFVKEGELLVNYKVARKRAIGLKANFGIADAQYLLEHQKEIPAEFFETEERIVFPGTLLRDKGGSLMVGYLFLGIDGRWHGAFRGIYGPWGSHEYLARRKK